MSQGSGKSKNFSRNDFFGIQPSQPEWLLEEAAFGLDEQHIQESLFTLGNGFIGSRGILEELPERALPGTFIAGVYDKSGAQVEELVNLPNPIHFIITAEGEKLDMNFMKVLGHKRYLDMQKGILMRKTLFMDGKKRKFVYRSLRFFSMSRQNLACVKISVTLLNGDAELTALDILDDSVTNTGGLIYGNRRHIRLMEADTKNEINYYAYRTHTSKIYVAYANHLSVASGKNRTALIDRVYNFRMKKGETVTFTKTLSVCTSLQHRTSNLKEEARRLLKEAAREGFNKNLKEHVAEWKARWDHANVRIEGDAACDKAVRLNVYHLLIAGYKGNFPASIGARALTGQGYIGHVFWDAEIFISPFYIYTDPIIAKNMLLYRYQRLDAARAIAREKGYKGALFPWESGAKGDDITPRYAKDTDGSIIEMDTMDYEQHISADIAYAIFNYYRATEDIDFVANHGAEMLFETARFWASRVTLNRARKKYEITNIMGPDEFHTNVKNNAYTNMMAAWNMRYASEIYDELKKKEPGALRRLESKLGVTRKETSKWLEISRAMHIPKSDTGKIIEQFEGYFKRKEINIKSFDSHFMPEAPQHISYDDFNKTKLIKQADTLLLLHLLSWAFTEEEKEKNYRYYIKRTIHQSSLSYSTHAMLAAELNDLLKAYILFKYSAELDLKNLHNNTDGGMHTAGLGGVWQAAIFGFAGVGFREGRLKIDPRLPGNWNSVRFSMFWKKSFLDISVQPNRVSVTCYPISSDHRDIEVYIFDKLQTLKPFKAFESDRERKVNYMKRVKEIMKESRFACAGENMTLKQVSQLLIEKGISSIPVVNEKSELVGLISEKDIIKSTEEENFSDLKAKNIMEKDVVYVKDDDHVEIAIRVFTEGPYRVLPVLRGKVVVGLLTRNDILSASFGESY